MSTVRIIGSAAVVLVSIAGTAFAQEPEITLGRLTISIGMTQGEVVRRAEVARQRVSAISQIERTAIVWETQATESSNRLLGSVVFENGLVKVVFKNWTPEKPEKDVDVGNALFSVANSFIQANNTRCTLSAATKNEPTQQEQRVMLQCGRRSIDISTVRNDQYRVLSTSVVETIK